MDKQEWIGAVGLFGEEGSCTTYMTVGVEADPNDVIAKAKELFNRGEDVYIVCQRLRAGLRQHLYQTFFGHRINMYEAYGVLPPRIKEVCYNLWGASWNLAQSRVVVIKQTRLRTSGGSQPHNTKALETFAPTKVCSVCGVEKPLTDFCIRYSARAKQEGLKARHCHSYCKACNSLYNKWRDEVCNAFNCTNLEEVLMQGYDYEPFKEWLRRRI